METYLTEFLWNLILLSLLSIGFIYGYILGQDMHIKKQWKCKIFFANNFESENDLEEITKELEQLDDLIVNKKILNSTLASLAIYNVRADRVSQQNEVEETRISIFNFHDCGVCIWDETIANPTIIFDSTSVSIQHIAGKELRIYSSNFPFFYRITEEHNPPEALEEMATKISELARNCHN